MNTVPGDNKKAN